MLFYGLAIALILWIKETSSFVLTWELFYLVLPVFFILLIFEAKHIPFMRQLFIQLGHYSKGMYIVHAEFRWWSLQTARTIWGAYALLLCSFAYSFVITTIQKILKKRRTPLPATT